MPRWALHGDLLAFAGLRLRLQRIGLDHWRAGATLRSWGAAPLHAAGDQLLAPCGTGEALWIGAWLDDEASANASADAHADAPADARIDATEPATGRSATLVVPPGYQISGLADAAGQLYPLTLAAHGEAVDLRLHLRAGQAQAQAHCLRRLCAPQAWAAAAGRPAPEPLAGPPPPPPRLG